MNLTEILGKNITERRRKLGLSQKELAARLGITQDAMARMEKGKIAPKMSRIEDLAAILDCAVPALFRRQNAPLQEQVAAAADILATLPHDGQEALVNLMADVARVMNLHKG